MKEQNSEMDKLYDVKYIVMPVDKNGTTLKIGDKIRFPYSTHELVEIDGCLFLRRTTDGELTENIYSAKYAEIVEA